MYMESVLVGALVNYFSESYHNPNSSNHNWSDKEFLEYHENQWKKSKHSTSKFTEFLSKELSLSKKVLDLGCGAGAALVQISRQNLDCKFIGIDHSKELIDIAKRQTARLGILNVEFLEGNILNLDKQQDMVDGVTCVQTISWMDDFRNLVFEIIDKIQPKWIALSGLFYRGDISARIEILEHERKTKTYFNVYALPEISRFIAPLGFKIESYQPFDLNVDLPKPENINIMQTYTERLVSNRGESRIQISGPLLINSGFLKLTSNVN